MLAFFRRITKSRLGVFITFAVLIMIAVAFAAGDVSGLGGKGSSMTPTSVATIGKAKLDETDLLSDAKQALGEAQQRQPTLDMAAFVAGGGLDQTLDRSVDLVAFEQFARQQDMVISRALVDKQIAEAPSLRGMDGKFSQKLYDQLLAARRMTDAQFHDELFRTAYAQQLVAPTSGATSVSEKLALPYASLALEKRAGQVAFVPIQAVGAGAAPAAAELQTWYTRNLGRYSVPERRIVRFAMVTADTVKAQATPTDAEIATVYKADAARYAPAEKRDLIQVTVLDQKAADALVAKVKAGTAIDVAARAAGLEPQTLTAFDKAGFTAQSSAAAGTAVFSAASGAVVGPVRTTLGWAVVKVAKIAQVPGKSLDQAKPELVADLTKQKTLAAMSKVHDALDDGISGGSTFDELVKDKKLAALNSPALTITGTDPDNAAAKPDPALTPLVQAAFQAQQGDTPQLVQIGQDGSFALVSLGKVVPAAPRPLAQIHDIAARDFQIDRAQKGARKIAADIVAKVSKGIPLAQALGQAGVALPAPRPMVAARKDIMQNPRGAPPELALMFSMAPKSAKLIEAPNGAGWLIVQLDKTEPGDARSQPQLVAGARGQLSQLVGGEYVQQFASAVRAEIGVKRNAAAIAQVRATLLGQTPAAQP